MIDGLTLMGLVLLSMIVGVWLLCLVVIINSVKDIPKSLESKYSRTEDD